MLRTCLRSVTSVYSTVTGFCDLGAELAGRLRGPCPRIKFVEALGYFGADNFAKRIPPPATLTLAVQGLETTHANRRASQSFGTP